MTNVHILAANQVTSRHLSCVAVCGAVVHAAGSPTDDPAYCAECVRAAADWHALVGSVADADAVELVKHGGLA